MNLHLSPCQQHVVGVRERPEGEAAPGEGPDGGGDDGLHGEGRDGRQRQLREEGQRRGVRIGGHSDASILGLAHVEVISQ